jgi:hypothetical protein
MWGYSRSQDEQKWADHVEGTCIDGVCRWTEPEALSQNRSYGWRSKSDVSKRKCVIASRQYCSSFFLKIYLWNWLRAVRTPDDVTRRRPGDRSLTAYYSGTSVYVLNPFQILGLIPNRSYSKRIFSIRNKGKMINPFSWKKNPIVIGMLYCT